MKKIKHCKKPGLAIQIDSIAFESKFISKKRSKISNTKLDFQHKLKAIGEALLHFLEAPKSVNFAKKFILNTPSKKGFSLFSLYSCIGSKNISELVKYFSSFLPSGIKTEIFFVNDVMLFPIGSKERRLRKRVLPFNHISLFFINFFRAKTSFIAILCMKLLRNMGKKLKSKRG